MTKVEFRKKYKKLRASLSSDDVQVLSLSIKNQLELLNIWDKEYYHLFLTIKEQKEIDTTSVLDLLKKQNKKIVLSKSDFSNNTLSHFLLTDITKIVLNQYGIPEPESGKSISENMIDVVFIPLLAFDKQGNRVGYGKGFYDDFLANCKPNVIKIGLSFFEAEDCIEGVFENDIPLDICVTPKQIYKF